MPQQAGSAAVKARGKALVDATADTTGERPTIAQIDPIPELVVAQYSQQPMRL